MQDELQLMKNVWKIGKEFVLVMSQSGVVVFWLRQTEAY